jgi:hypothetical protein
MSARAASDAALDRLQRDAFGFFLVESNPVNGLVPDSTRPGSPSSIAAVGFALAAYAAGAERGLMPRGDAIARVLATLRFFWASPQGTERDATGYKGFYYHFLDMRTGRRAWASELSTIDTTFLLAGALAAAAYFDRDAARRRTKDFASTPNGGCRRLKPEYRNGRGLPEIAKGFMDALGSSRSAARYALLRG